MPGYRGINLPATATLRGQQHLQQQLVPFPEPPALAVRAEEHGASSTPGLDTAIAEEGSAARSAWSDWQDAHGLDWDVGESPGSRFHLLSLQESLGPQQVQVGGE